MPWGNLPTILGVEFAALAWAESQRNNETDMEKKKYPGGAFDPLGEESDLSSSSSILGVRALLSATRHYGCGRTISKTFCSFRDSGPNWRRF